MQETSGPKMEPLAIDAHLLQPIIERARRDPGRAAASHREGSEFVDVTAGELYDRVRRIAKGLLASGVEPEDRVALMSHSRLEWMLIDYAILATGAVTVPAYETSSAEQLQWIVSDSEAVLLIVETPAMRALHGQVGDRTPSCREVLVIDEGAVTELERRGSDVDDGALDERIHGLTTDRLATIIYTSGTTGRPKGCVLTHGNLRANTLQSVDAVRAMLGDNESCLVFLPLAHSLTKIIVLVCAEWGARPVFVTDIASLPEEMTLAQPTLMVAVPRIFEKIFNAAQHKAHGERRGAIFDRAADVAIRWSQDRSAGRRRPLVKIEHAIFDRLLYTKVRAVFGGRLRFAVSGGGPLGERLTDFFAGVGIMVFEGYGLTETSPSLTINREGAWRSGTVGQALAGTSIKIARDGEILAKGPQVFQGYWHDDAATAETFDEDGWFRTGDVGELDDEGFLRITGRKKELIVTAAGKNVAPAPLEDRLRAHPLISQAVVVGDGRPFVGAILTLDESGVADWADEHHRSDVTVIDLVDDDELHATLQSAIDDTNQSVSRAESIRKFAILSTDLTVEAGELTPTLKVRRTIVAKTHADSIDGLYGT